MVKLYCDGCGTEVNEDRSLSVEVVVAGRETVVALEHSCQKCRFAVLDAVQAAFKALPLVKQRAE
jgi:hypothetical protein